MSYVHLSVNFSATRLDVLLNILLWNTVNLSVDSTEVSVGYVECSMTSRESEIFCG
jgi:hypothetical protein